MVPFNDYQEKKRVISIDIARIIACMLVVIVHNNNKVLYQLRPLSLAWFIVVIIFFVGKTAVPTFFMIAGYNLLHKSDNWGKAWVRIRRILVDLVLFSLIYYVWKCLEGGIVCQGTWDYVFGFVKMFVRGPITDSYWYLYAYLGLMLILPFLQKITLHMNEQDISIFLILALVFVCIIPTAQVFFPGLVISSDFSLGVIIGSVSYMMLGHLFWLSSNSNVSIYRIVRLPAWVYAIGFVLGLVMNMVASVSEFKSTAGESFLTIGEIEYLPLVLESICVFSLYMKIKSLGRMDKVVEVVSATTFGVYLMADGISTATIMLYYNLCPRMNRLFAVAVQDVVVLFVGFAIVYHLKKIPGVKEYL